MSPRENIDYQLPLSNYRNAVAKGRQHEIAIMCAQQLRDALAEPDVTVLDTDQDAIQQVVDAHPDIFAMPPRRMHGEATQPALAA